MHFVMSAFSNHAVVLHSVTPFVLLQQTAVLSDGVVVSCLYKYGAGPFLSCGGVGGRSPTGCLCRVCISMVPDHSSPVEGWRAKPDGVVVACLYKYGAGPFPSCGGVAGEARRGVCLVSV